jgi:hypothetical protein
MAYYVTPSKPISESKAVFGQQQFSFIHHSKIIFSYSMTSLKISPYQEVISAPFRLKEHLVEAAPPKENISG